MILRLTGDILIPGNFGDQLFFYMENLHTRFIMLLNMLISKKTTEKFSGQLVTSNLLMPGNFEEPQFFSMKKSYTSLIMLMNMLISKMTTK